MTQDALEVKREQLEDFEKSEREARRLEEALGGRGLSRSAPSGPQEGPEAGEAETVTDDNERNTYGAASSSSPSVPPHPGPNPARRRSNVPGMGFLNALSYTLHGMMDVDPETARRNGISKNREQIAQVRDVH